MRTMSVAYAAQSAYFILLSFIPFVLLVVTLVKYTPLTRDDVYSVLINMLPTGSRATWAVL